VGGRGGAAASATTAHQQPELLEGELAFAVPLGEVENLVQRAV
jgi:hypothetical protein